ncbi:hypothetical protein [Seonamhaeicola sp.]|uniref:hypothetical protein n=1 Tax=Seonamhaeicola sp. TaxID=1912245 RepID=UPI00260FECCF|nr:hypothetical protein [Seonamhaeicola sp.]
MIFDGFFEFFVEKEKLLLGLKARFDGLHFSVYGKAKNYYEGFWMSFILERLRNGISEFLDEHEEAVRLSKGVPINKRLVDSEKKALLYCLSMGGGPDDTMFPGVYVLFVKGSSHLLRISESRSWKDGVGNVVNYYVQESTGFDFSDFERDENFSILEDALKSWEAFLPYESVITKIEYAKGL